MPRASTAFTLDGKQVGELDAPRTMPASSRASSSIRKRQPLRYRASNAGGEWWRDRSLFLRPGARADGRLLHRRRHRISGCSTSSARISIEHEGADGVHFAVWAPNARRVSVVGDFNDWDGRRHPMRQRQRHRHLGDLHSRHRARASPTNTRSSAPDGAAAAAEGRSVRLPLRAAPGDRLGHRGAGAVTTGATTRTATTGARPIRGARPISIYEVHPARGSGATTARFLT